MRAADKRILAEKAIEYARKGKYKEASRIRQRAYEKDPPGSIGVDWNCWSAIWDKDKSYLSYLNSETFCDLKNTKEYIESMKASIFVDYLFDFRDGWGASRHQEYCREELSCLLLDNFLKEMDLEEEWREFVYMSTVKRNISSKMYIDATKAKGMPPSEYPYMTYIYEPGEYHIGILKGTPERQAEQILSGRRQFLKEYKTFEQCSLCGIEKFPKTFQTFQKHKLANSEKYQEWMRQYDIIRNQK